MRALSRCCVALGVAASLGAGPPDAGAPALEQVLHELDRRAQVSRQNALQFTCDEIIYVHTDAGRETHRFQYIYVRDGAGQLTEYRVHYKRNRRHLADPSEAVNPMEYDIPAALLRAYFWVNIFAGETQEHFRYEHLGAEEIEGRQTWKIAFVPVPPIEPWINEFGGTAWVDAETFHLLRVEARAWEDILMHRALEKCRDGGPADCTLEYYEYQTVVTDFGRLEQGQRFPSEVVIERRRHTGRPGREAGSRRIFKVRQVYRDYRFYDVETVERIERVESGG